jgi:hypothetical protein
MISSDKPKALSICVTDTVKIGVFTVTLIPSFYSALYYPENQVNTVFSFWTATYARGPSLL